MSDHGPKIPRMRIQLVVRAACEVGGKPVAVGDVLDIDTATMDVVIASRAPVNMGAVLGLLAQGVVDPVDISPDRVSALLRTPAMTPPPSAPRVLAFRSRARREA